MLRQIIQIFIVLLVGSKNKPVYDLHKKQPFNLQGLDWTFILLTLALILFFVSIFVFQIGNEYPNELMSNL